MRCSVRLLNTTSLQEKHKKHIVLIDVLIIFKYLRETGLEVVDWIHLDRLKWRVLVNMAMNLRAPWKAVSFLT